MSEDRSMTEFGRQGVARGLEGLLQGAAPLVDATHGFDHASRKLRVGSAAAPVSATPRAAAPRPPIRFLPVPSPEGSAGSRPRATSRPHRDRHAVPAQGADLRLRPGRVQAASAIRAQGFGLPVAAFGMVVRDAPKNLTPQRDPPMAAVRVRFARQSPEKGNRLQPSGCGITRSRTRGATCAAMPSGMSRRGQRRFCKAWSQTTGLPGIKAVPLGAAVRRIGRDPA